MSAKNEAEIKLKADVAGFNAEIKKAGSVITELRSELRLNSEEMKTGGASVDGLSEQLRILSDISGQYDQKISALTSKMQETAKVYGENSEECRRLQTQINNTAAAQQKITQQINSTTDQLNEMKAGLDSASGEMSYTRTKTEQLSDAINKQKTDLEALKDSYKSVALDQGKNSAEAKALAKEIQSLSGELKENEARMKDVESAADRFDQSLEDVKNTSGEVGDGFSVMGGAISSFIGNVLADGVSKIGDFAQSIFELSDATEEYRTMMAKASGSAESFGYSISDAKDRYAEFYRYLGDDQMATNAITNLLGMKVNTETLDNVINGAIATWTAYGDSIPIESLTESITETVNVSKVTGTFADTINWATLSNEQWNNVLGQGSDAQKAFNASLAEGEAVEDAFSAALAATSDQQGRANLVAALLNETYGQSKTTYDSLSGSILDANSAELELKETQAELGETLTPLNTKFTQLKTKALKSMSPMIEDVTESFGDMIEGIDWDEAADMIGNVMDVAVDGLGWLSKNIKPVTTLVISLGSAWLTYKGVMAGANAVSTVANGLMTAKAVVTGTATAAVVTQTAATEAATVAQQGLNLAQMASPIALVTAGAVALGVGIYTLVQRQNELIEQEYGLTEAQKANIETVNEMRDSYEEMDTARQESMSSVAAEYGHLQALKDELVTLVDANGQIKAGEEDRANFIINQLSQALGIEEQDIRDIIAANGDLSASLDTVIQKKQAEAMLSANEEAYKEAIQNQVEALKVYNQALEDAQEAEQNYKNAMEESADVLEEYELLKETSAQTAGTYYWAHRTEIEGAQEAKAAYEEASSALADAEATYVGYCSTIENYEGASAAILSGDADAIESTMVRLQNSFITAEQGTQVTLKQQVTDYQQMYEDLQMAVQTGAPGVTQEAVTQAQNLVTQAQAELNKFEQQAPGAAANGIAGFNASISAGASGAGVAASSVTGSAESRLRAAPFSLIGNMAVGDYTASVRNGSESAGKAAGEVASEAETELDTADTNSAGRNFVEGFINGMSAVNILKPVRNLASRALDALEDALGIESPSKEAYERGDYFTQGFVNAVVDGEKNARKASENLAYGALQGIEGFEAGWNGILDPITANASFTLNDHISAMLSQAMASNLFDYDRMEEIMVRAAEKANIKIVTNNREIARTRTAMG